MSNKKIALELISCPGDTIAEILEERSLTKQWLAQQLGTSGNKTWKLLKGKVYLTSAMAAQLEGIFKVDKQFWINREKLYRDKQKAINRL